MHFSYIYRADQKSLKDRRSKQKSASISPRDSSERDLSHGSRISDYGTSKRNSKHPTEHHGMTNHHHTPPQHRPHPQQHQEYVQVQVQQHTRSSKSKKSRSVSPSTQKRRHHRRQKSPHPGGGKNTPSKEEVAVVHEKLNGHHHQQHHQDHYNPMTNGFSPKVNSTLDLVVINLVFTSI